MLTKSSLLSSLADVQRLYFEAVCDDDSYMIQVWEKEIERINNLLENNNG